MTDAVLLDGLDLRVEGLQHYLPLGTIDPSDGQQLERELSNAYDLPFEDNRRVSANARRVAVTRSIAPRADAEPDSHGQAHPDYYAKRMVHGPIVL